MKVHGNVSDILNCKGREVFTTTPEDTVFHAIELMTQKNVGALPVVEGKKLVGIISERDYTRKVILQGRASKKTRVKEIMTTPVITAEPGHSVDQCMQIMTEKRIRHLPLVERSALIGLISIGDLVNWTISIQSGTIDQLEDYITGKYPG